MAYAKTLTPNCISRMVNGEEVIQPKMQILAYKKVMHEDASQHRYRFLMSDGVHSYQCFIMMGKDLIPRLERGEFEKYTIVQLDNYVLNNVSNKKVFIITDPKVIHKGVEVNEKIGNPITYNGPTATPNRSLNAPVAGAVPSASRPQQPNTPKANLSQSVPEPIVRIEDLNPYRNRWSIKGRVTSKTSVKTWNNAKGEGKLFSFDIGDDSGEIRVTAFKAECDKYFDIIEIGKVYIISKAQIKEANRKFSTLKHDFELTLSSDSSVIIGDENDLNCPKISYDFLKIKDIANAKVDSVVDVIGVCRSVSDVVTFPQRNTGKELKKRDITLVDDTETEIKFTVWGTEAENCSASEGTAVVAKKVKVSDFNGKSLTAIANTSVLFDPSIREAFGLKGWYDRSRDTLNPTQLSVNTGFTDNAILKCLREINMQNVKKNGGSIGLSAKATIVQVGRSQTYISCPDGCKKKLIDMNNGLYKCDKCNKQHQDFETRMLLSLAISDWGGECWVSVFHDDAEKLLGISASQLRDMKDAGQPELEETMAALNFRTCIFRLKCNVDHYREEIRLKTVVQGYSPLTPLENCKKLLQNLKELDK